MLPAAVETARTPVDSAKVEVFPTVVRLHTALVPVRGRATAAMAVPIRTSLPLGKTPHTQRKAGPNRIARGENRIPKTKP